MFTGIIYQVLHIATEKCYIGQTVDSLKERRRKHLRKAFHKNRQNALCKALRDFGELAFEFTQLEEVQGETRRILQEKLDQKEKEYIAKYDSVENGFNTRRGGQGFTEKRVLSPEERAEKKAKCLAKRRIRNKANYEANREKILALKKTPEYRAKQEARKNKRYLLNPEKAEQARLQHIEYMRNSENRVKQKARQISRMSDPEYRKAKRDRERNRRNEAQRRRRAAKKLEANKCQA